ncbi:unnamed protein product [Vitrella brassicaformis CCMP3155]|uniref:Selenoprotein K n=1 Tax=Vitrella brassicaformis (strain CCMP3155) TaxID=1169540 RepID=A0A0G4EP42_VITBC|nr:unnamed protein product [Vitrella brassicaformis CCMP3155]|mmetsp:Transcript_40857/g.102113  ORF Transcript_40857/g.102113 Transcript_40857/m.102113 type:complete len:80 (+) Transcript_40857:106-345(+)|eukprot:CEL99394.1 unnamed protein product [Vitrella brassicaformis CCMP3155]
MERAPPRIVGGKIQEGPAESNNPIIRFFWWLVAMVLLFFKTLFHPQVNSNGRRRPGDGGPPGPNMRGLRPRMNVRGGGG